MEFVNHYHVTPPERSKTENDCWKDLSDYMKEHAEHKLCFFRVTPEVVSEVDYDTKETRHRGIIRFSAKEIDTSRLDKIPSIGEI